MNYNLKIYFNKINYFFLFLVCILAAINLFLDLLQILAESGGN